MAAFGVPVVPDVNCKFNTSVDCTAASAKCSAAFDTEEELSANEIAEGIVKAGAVA